MKFLYHVYKAARITYNGKQIRKMTGRVMCRACLSEIEEVERYVCMGRDLG